MGTTEDDIVNVVLRENASATIDAGRRNDKVDACKAATGLLNLYIEELELLLEQPMAA